MSVRLQSFQYLPRGADGWGSRLLHFGEMFTAVQGPNGAGKTPIMKGVIQGLGHEVELPPDILARCEFAETTIAVDGRAVTLTRRLGEDFNLRVVDAGESRIYASQAEYAKWFIGLFSADPPALTSKQSQEVGLYPTVLLPALWVDQDHGWTTDYWTPANRNFIQDQRQEVIRFLLGVAPRHPFRAKTEFDEAKLLLERTVATIETQRFIVDRLRTNEQLNDNEEAGLVERQTRLRADLAANSTAIEAIRTATSFYDREIAALEAERNATAVRIGALNKQRGQLSLVLSELDGEEDILTANVHATDLLRQFCGREGCQMFATSERSFGRSLLFLKDQIKDLQASDKALSRDVESRGRDIERLEAAIAAKRTEREEAVNASPQAEVAGKLNALTKELVDVELRLARVRQYVSERQKFERLLDQREQASARVSETRPTGVRGASAADDARQMLSDSIQQWLVTLGTQNTKTAHFDEDFKLFVDGARFSTTTHQSGSTRTRIVLAFHAALLEVSLARGGNHPGWLLFDAPKQHELSQTDFDAYTERLQLIAAKHPGRVQVVFSVADLKTQFQAGDEVWPPAFTFDGSPRFLGPVEKESKGGSRSTAQGADRFLYFAYGSNMLKRRLTASNRTPSAQAQGTGHVPGYRFTFDKRSADGSGKGDMLKTGVDTDRVQGVLFSIARTDEAALDAAEGYSKDSTTGYNKVTVTVMTPDGPQEAIAYIARDPEASVPYHWYKALVVAGAMEHNLPADYVEWLRAFVSQDDANAQRRAENEQLLNAGKAAEPPDEDGR